MPVEIERKFLVVGDAWQKDAIGIEMKQGYLSDDPDRSVRIRIAGAKAMLTIKGRSEGIARIEFEYEIPVEDADQLMGLCIPSVVEKTRHEVEEQGFTWEIDVFHGDNEGLIIAEIELDEHDVDIPLPAWVGDEVSDDPRYFNLALAQHPFRDW